MEKVAKAILADGTELPYVIKDNPPKGGMKYTYFAPDKSYVVQFFNDPDDGNDPNLRARLEAIIGKYNPTRAEADGGARGCDAKMAEYFSKCFCWPTATVVSPEFGIVCPAYPKNFFFGENSSKIPELKLKGKDKRSNWFTNRNRTYLAEQELGDWRYMLRMSNMLARAIRRMHQAGLAHSDLSNNNVLIDPPSGSCVVIDIDSLVVPGLFPPEVAGTPRYMAPEVLESTRMPRNDPRRSYPSVTTDLHALPVLIYEYLLLRHPLIGPKIYSHESSEEDDYLALGPMATFIENPSDRSNRPNDLYVTIDDLGKPLHDLFIRSFVDGLHNPDLRPTAMDWERGLVKTWDLLHRCTNPKCLAKWFVLYDTKRPVCPFCKTRITDSQLVRFKLKSEVRGRCGQWTSAGELDVSDNMPLFRWHFYSNCYPGEKADSTMAAYVCRVNGDWLLVNQTVSGMLSPGGNVVPSGKAVLLKNGTVFRGSKEQFGYLIEVEIVDIALE